MSNLLYFAIPAFVVLIALEAFFAWRRQQKVYETKDTLACLAMGAGNVVIATLFKLFVLWLMFLLWQNLRLFNIPYEGLALLWVIPLLIICEDFCYYWFHRLHHETRIGWAAHVNHHSSQRFNLAVALRQSWTTPITGFVFWLPLPLIGFHPLLVLLAQSISLIYQFWIHTESIKTLGVLERIFNTPSHHRVHHGSNPQYIDKNYAGIFIVWDKLFNSFEPEQEPVRYGLTKNLTTFNPLKIASHEWISLGQDIVGTLSHRERWQFLWRRPGWHPNIRANDSAISDAASDMHRSTDLAEPSVQQTKNHE